MGGPVTKTAHPCLFPVGPGQAGRQLALVEVTGDASHGRVYFGDHLVGHLDEELDDLHVVLRDVSEEDPIEAGDRLDLNCRTIRKLRRPADATEDVDVQGRLALVIFLWELLRELQGIEAESVTRLKNAGVLIMGNTVTTEFAYFSPGPTRNPHNPEHTPGGSSSGSAAAVAAGFCHLALGTQTIGSIIRPASFCGVVGLKPTYERISREGMIPLSPSLDHVGFFVPDVESAIHAARELYEEWDEPTMPLKRPVLGIPDGPYLQSASEEGLAHFEALCKLLEGAGYELRHAQVMSDFAEIRARNDVIMSAEAAEVHKEWFEKYADLYSSKTAELIKRGQSITNDQLQKALTARDDFRAELRRAVIDHNIDIWICPSTVGAAPRGLESTGDPVMNLPWTQAGLPAINLPSGKNQDGLPMGLQVVGNWHKDESLLFWAKDLERVLSTI